MHLYQEFLFCKSRHHDSALAKTKTTPVHLHWCGANSPGPWPTQAASHGQGYFAFDQSPVLLDCFGGVSYTDSGLILLWLRYSPIFCFGPEFIMDTTCGISCINYFQVSFDSDNTCGIPCINYFQVSFDSSKIARMVCTAGPLAYVTTQLSHKYIQ